MKLVKLSYLFQVKYGLNLVLNRLILDEHGVNFVSRTAINNGVSAKVRRIPDVEPLPAGCLTVAGGGSVLETFLQPDPFYSGRDLYYLSSKELMSEPVKLYYCACIRANKYRYNYGRQANRTLKDIEIPAPEEIPDWVNQANPHQFDHADAPVMTVKKPIPLSVERWKSFPLDQLFVLKKGNRLTKADMMDGTTTYIGAIDSNNGVSAYIGQKPKHKGGTITVTYNGSVAEAFYQPISFWATDDVNVLYPKFPMNKYIALFLCTIIRREKYRFNYGRKWHLERMNESVIKLPVTSAGEPDWQFMERYIKSMNFSSKI